MFQKFRIFFQALVVLAVMIFVVPTFAKRDGKHLEKLTKELGLTSEQQEKIKALHNHEQIKSQREVMRKAHEELEQAMKSPATDEEVRIKYTNLERAQSEFSKLRFEKVLAIRAILTPEQRMNFKGMAKDGEFKQRKRKRSY